MAVDDTSHAGESNTCAFELFRIVQTLIHAEELIGVLYITPHAIIAKKNTISRSPLMLPTSTTAGSCRREYLTALDGRLLTMGTSRQDRCYVLNAVQAYVHV